MTAATYSSALARQYAVNTATKRGKYATVSNRAATKARAIKSPAYTGRIIGPRRLYTVVRTKAAPPIIPSTSARGSRGFIDRPVNARNRVGLRGESETSSKVRAPTG